MRALLLPLLGATALAGCATTWQKPIEQLTDARAAIRAVEEMDADQVPSAAAVLQVARQEADRATQLMELGQDRRAEYLLRRAEAGAELAMALAREAPVRADAARAAEQVNQLETQVKP